MKMRKYVFASAICKQYWTAGASFEGVPLSTLLSDLCKGNDVPEKVFPMLVKHIHDQFFNPQEGYEFLEHAEDIKAARRHLMQEFATKNLPKKALRLANKVLNGS